MNLIWALYSIVWENIWKTSGNFHSNELFLFSFFWYLFRFRANVPFNIFFLFFILWAQNSHRTYTHCWFTIGTTFVKWTFFGFPFVINNEKEFRNEVICTTGNYTTDNNNNINFISKPSSVRMVIPSFLFLSLLFSSPENILMKKKNKTKTWSLQLNGWTVCVKFS